MWSWINKDLYLHRNTKSTLNKTKTKPRPTTIIIFFFFLYDIETDVDDDDWIRNVANNNVSNKTYVTYNAITFNCKQNQDTNLRVTLKPIIYGSSNEKRLQKNISFLLHLIQPNDVWLFFFRAATTYFIGMQMTFVYANVCIVPQLLKQTTTTKMINDKRKWFANVTLAVI